LAFASGCHHHNVCVDERGESLWEEVREHQPVWRERVCACKALLP
jgi:hypothetical protein